LSRNDKQTERRRTIEQLREGSSLGGLSHVPLDDVLPTIRYINTSA
jgi:hypothetical protein